MAFEQLKEKLWKEGLFEESRKKPLPKYPETIAIITSSAGAAVHDMIRILRRRYPLAKVKLLPVRVQGAEAQQLQTLRLTAEHVEPLALQPLQQLRLIGRGQLRGVGGRGRPDVRHKVGNGHVRLVAHGGDDGNFRIIDGRGFALVTNNEGKPLRRTEDAPVGSQITARLSDGRLVCRVEESITEEEPS